MRSWLALVVVAVAACGDSASDPDASPAPADAPAADAPGPADALDPADAASADAAPPDAAPPDAAPPDAAPPCPTVFDAPETVTGDVTIRTALDVQALAGKRAITGEVLIDGDLAEVVLPDVEYVGG